MLSTIGFALTVRCSTPPRHWKCSVSPVGRPARGWHLTWRSESRCFRRIARSDGTVLGRLVCARQPIPACQTTISDEQSGRLLITPPFSYSLPIKPDDPSSRLAWTEGSYPITTRAHDDGSRSGVKRARIAPAGFVELG